MKIKRIQVKNIGPYVNENAFDFDVSDITKRMVLIGGKNGAGKTTLFNAIKICLYGCVAYGFESNNAKYFAEIEKIINANEKLQKIGEAEVVIDLLMDDGKYDHTYTFVRSWRVAGKKIAETFTVYKDGETLSETGKSDFESYLLQTLPPNLFRFYFFDGEKISDFVFNSSKNSDFKDAFLKLCSLDTIKVFKTWAGTQEYVDADTARFEKIWNRKDRNLKIFTIPQAVKNKIFELRSPDRPYSLPAGSSKWVHQDIAVKTFLEKEHGILAMATGTGKTVTAMKIINKLFDSGEIRRVVITMYGNDLLDQWAIQGSC
jgi:predicted ATP-binding protein involved in virulence